MRVLVESIFILAAITLVTPAFATECDASKVVRQAVKVLLPVEGTKVSSISVVQRDKDANVALFRVEAVYVSTKDAYAVEIRNRDCRILDIKLVAENVPTAGRK